MAQTVIFSNNGQTIYPATIPDAIIDPSTGQPVNLAAALTHDEYSINNIQADETGNFTITNTDLGAAAESHVHEISDIINLQETLNTKSNTDHTHEMVKSISINGSNIKLSGDIKLVGKNNVQISENQNNITISITPNLISSAEKIKNIKDEKEYKFFIGTEAEWNNFKESINENDNYIVFIRS